MLLDLLFVVCFWSLYWPFGLTFRKHFGIDWCSRFGLQRLMLVFGCLWFYTCCGLGRLFFSFKLFSSFQCFTSFLKTFPSSFYSAKRLLSPKMHRLPLFSSPSTCTYPYHQTSSSKWVPYSYKSSALCLYSNSKHPFKANCYVCTLINCCYLIGQLYGFFGIILRVFQRFRFLFLVLRELGVVGNE